MSIHISRATSALALTVVLWASAFPAIRVGLAGYGVAGLSLLRLVVASLALAPAAPLLRVRLPRRADLPLIALCGASGMSAYQLLLNWGETHVPAGTASLLISVAPVFSVFLATIWLGERPSRRTVVGSVVAIAGCALIALAGGGAGYSTGAWIVLAAALAQGVYHFASKPLLRHYTGLEVACYAMWAGTLFLAPGRPVGRTRRADRARLGHGGGRLPRPAALGGRFCRLGLRRGPAVDHHGHRGALPGPAGRACGRVRLAARDTPLGGAGRRPDQHRRCGTDQPAGRATGRGAGQIRTWRRLTH
ncbi:MAG TPA: DMT family transporter [Pseudonocardiaceae bacterium]|nr:DMT family transporter [Pseudonocardiaceae bacterium]